MKAYGQRLPFESSPVPTESIWAKTDKGKDCPYHIAPLPREFLFCRQKSFSQNLPKLIFCKVTMVLFKIWPENIREASIALQTLTPKLNNSLNQTCMLSQCIMQFTNQIRPMEVATMELATATFIDSEKHYRKPILGKKCILVEKHHSHHIHCSQLFRSNMHVLCLLTSILVFIPRAPWFQ